MKTTFLIDGAAGTGKSDMVKYLSTRKRSAETLIQKFTTRKERPEERGQKRDLLFPEDTKDQFLERTRDDWRNRHRVVCCYGRLSSAGKGRANSTGALGRFQYHHHVDVVGAKIVGVAGLLVQPLIKARAFARIHQAAQNPLDYAAQTRALFAEFRINALTCVADNVE